MTEGRLRPTPWGSGWPVACLAVLMGIVIYSDTLEPIVRTLGLAHARILHGDSGRILVVDSVASADAPLLQTVFQGEIWGRHGFAVHQILLPFGLLLLALAGLSHRLAHSVSSAALRFYHLRRGSALPPLVLWVALFLGGCLAAWSQAGPRFHPTFAMLPFVLAVLFTAGMSASPHPSSTVMARSFIMLSLSRWFWLGFLMLSPAGLFRYDAVAEGSQPLMISAVAVMACVLSLAVLQQASRAPRWVDFGRFTGETASLRRDFELYSIVSVQELWLLLPAFFMAAVVSSLRIDYVAPYLLCAAACALLMKWSVEARPSPGESLATRLVGHLARLVTIALLLALPFASVMETMFASHSWPLVPWLVVIGLALVRGRPWVPARAGSACPANQGFPGREATRAGSSEEAYRLPAEESQPLLRSTARAALLALAALTVVGVALRGGLPFGARDPVLATAQSDLGRSFGHQARLVRLDDTALLVGCNLDVARLSLAAEIVSKHLPGEETRVVSVRTRQWERTARAFLALTVAVFLVFPTYLLTFAAPAPASRGYLLFCALLGGANGAFAIGAALGWFWLDPMPHLAAFILSTSLAWLGLGYARAWLDNRVASLGRTPAPGHALGGA